MPPGPNRNGDFFIHRVDSAARFAREIHRRTGAPLPAGFQNDDLLPVPELLAPVTTVATTTAPNYAAAFFPQDSMGSCTMASVMATMASLTSEPAPEVDQPFTRYPLRGFAPTPRRTLEHLEQERFEYRQEYAAAFMADMVAQEHDDYVDALMLAATREGPRIPQFEIASNPQVNLRTGEITEWAQPARAMRAMPAMHGPIDIDDYRVLEASWTSDAHRPDAPIVELILAARARGSVCERRSVWERLLEDV